MDFLKSLYADFVRRSPVERATLLAVWFLIVALIAHTMRGGCF